MRVRAFLRAISLAVSFAVCEHAYAQSSVTLYGIVDDAIVYANNQKGHSNIYLRQGNNIASRWGIKGSDDLGDGTKAIFDLQAGFDPNSGSAAATGLIFNRQEYVGLQNNKVGTITFGRQYTPSYALILPLTFTYWLTGATGTPPGGIDGLDSTLRVNNSVVYTSPEMRGLQFSAQYGFSGIAGAAGSGNTVAAAARYFRGPLSLAAGYVRMTNADTASGGFSSSSSATFFPSVINEGYLSAHTIQQFVADGNYRIGDLTLGANYANLVYRPDASSSFGSTAVFNIFGVLAAYRFSPVFSAAGGFSFTRASQSNGITDPARYFQYSFQENYFLSKRTTIYLLQAWQHASGRTLGPMGGASIIPALPAIGDSQDLTPSSTANQFVGMVGITTAF